MYTINFTKSISMVNSISFISLSIYEYILYKKTKNTILWYSSLLLFIAGIHYSILDVNRPNITQELFIRYSDWFFTTPLLLLVAGLKYNMSNKLIQIAIAYNMIMIISGVYYEYTGNINYWYIGSLSYLIMLYILYSNINSTIFWKYFVVGWSGYGVVSLLPRYNRIFIYNILDFYNKFIFAVELNHM